MTNRRLIQPFLALAGLSLMFALAGCDGQEPAATAVRPASSTTVAPTTPATPAAVTDAAVSSETAPVATAAPAAAVPEGFTKAHTPDGKEILVDLRPVAEETAPATPSEGAVAAITTDEATKPAEKPAETAESARAKRQVPPSNIIGPTKGERANVDIATTGDPTRGPGNVEAVKATDPNQPPAPPVPVGPQTVFPEPASLDLGQMPTGEAQAIGNVKLVNKGDKAMRLLDCQSSCGCTAAKCPKNQLIEPGQHADIEIRMNPGFVAHKVTKSVTFKVEGQPDFTVPVSLEVIAYIVSEPEELDAESPGEGKFKIKSTDGLPFTITGMTPALLTELSKEAKPEHEITLPPEAWQAIGRRPKLVINTDHPKCPTFYFRFKPNFKPQTPANPAQVVQKGPEQQMLDCVRANDAACVDRMITEGLVKADARAADNATGLVIAARQGHVDVMKVFLKHKADVEMADKAGLTALSHAAQSKNDDAVALLLDAGADVTARDEISGTPLTWACGPLGSAGAVRQLVEHGADVNVVNSLNYAPIHWCSWWGAPEAVSLVASKVADINAYGGPENATALMFAVQYNRPEVVKVLLEKGADPTLVDPNKKSALDFARARAEKDEAGKAILAMLEAITGAKAEPAKTSSAKP